MNANVIIYCRVSSDEQTLGASLDVQEERLRKYCNKWDIISLTISHTERMRVLKHLKSVLSYKE